MRFLAMALALALGALIAWVDSGPNWDDAGITALALFAVCGAFGYASPRRPWRWALAVGLWVPLLGIWRARSFGSSLALLVALAGAYAGMAVRRMLAPPRG